MKKFNALDWIIAALLIIGGLNWGFIGFFGVDVVGAIFGEMSGLARTVYALVGLSAIYALFIPSRMESEEGMHHGQSMKGAA